MATLDSVFGAAKDLPVSERVQLIEALWDTLPDDSLPPLSDEWVTEIQRRSAEFDSGKVKSIPWEAVRAELLSRLGRQSTHAPD